MAFFSAKLRPILHEPNTRAVIAADAKPLLVRYDERSVHYDTVFSVE